MDFIGINEGIRNQYLKGELEVELVPQGTLAERLRAGGSGTPAFYSQTGVDTVFEHGGLPILNFPDGGKPLIVNLPKESRIFDGKKYLLENALKTNFSLIKGWKADTEGNLIFRKSARNFNVDMAKAAKVCIAEVEEIVPAGELDPDHIHLPSIFVHRLVVTGKYQKRVEYLTTSTPNSDYEDSWFSPKIANGTISCPEMTKKRLRIAKRAAKEIKSGIFVNLGVGIPSSIINFIDSDKSVRFQSENGILGLGRYPTEDKVDPDIVNAGKETVTLSKGASIFSSSDSFSMIRGKHLDVSKTNLSL